MSEREAVERLISRMYKHHLKATGKLPSGREVREMEGKAISTATRAARKAGDGRPGGPDGR